ncbi:transmembrane protein 272-like isoform X1 [Bufo bufo]|uniref:transmembrane protein 272-like isoform X1 n=1 Tax=Bufo bufo TaxID=8384 RepID=UPI001ABE4BEF|nr:transmembrane protein 272-like isoform X1 [Bufo bufo]
MGLTFSGGFRVFILLLWSGLSTAMITIGVMYKDKCLLQPVVPFYLMVAGASYLMVILLVSLKCLSHQLFAVLKVFLLVFILCWLIAGSVWIFPIYFMFSVLCNSVLYQFAFGVLVFQYISIVIIFVTLVFAIYFTGLKRLVESFSI